MKGGGHFLHTETWNPPYAPVYMLALFNMRHENLCPAPRRGLPRETLAELAGDGPSGGTGGAALLQIPVPPEHRGKPYGVLFHNLLAEQGLICLGLLREKVSQCLPGRGRRQAPLLRKRALRTCVVDCRAVGTAPHTPLIHALPGSVGDPQQPPALRGD